MIGSASFYLFRFLYETVSPGSKVFWLRVKDASCLLCLVDWKNWNRAFASSIYADMVKLKILKGMLCVPIGRPASSPVREAPDGVTKKHPAEGEVTHPNKRTKLGTRKWL
ncbi:hypothetical protein OPV22_028955 [Ensete ventricosum]|uniref:Uncharacterized protein n=1 Tax=Ensete ventricosum TaxID=4639 RepID=A0AAV8PZP8_ENSVE|nr:hypothetical protein OPV22_028955 [Ensete ventricosum]